MLPACLAWGEVDDCAIFCARVRVVTQGENAWGIMGNLGWQGR